MKLWKVLLPRTRDESRFLERRDATSWLRFSFHLLGIDAIKDNAHRIFQNNIKSINLPANTDIIRRLPGKIYRALSLIVHHIGQQQFHARHRSREKTPAMTLRKQSTRRLPLASPLRKIPQKSFIQHIYTTRIGSSSSSPNNAATNRLFP